MQGSFTRVVYMQILLSITPCSATFSSKGPIGNQNFLSKRSFGIKCIPSRFHGCLRDFFIHKQGHFVLFCIILLCHTPTTAKILENNI